MPETLTVELVPRNRAIYQDRHVRIIIVARRRTHLHSGGRIHLRMADSSPATQLLQSGGGPYIINTYKDRQVLTSPNYGVISQTAPS